MSAKKILAWISVILILYVSVYVMIDTYKNTAGTYEHTTDVSVLGQNPEDYNESDPDGIADVIVKENLDKTNAINDVASIVFDFRGYDTLGESFILSTAIAGSFVILSKRKKQKKEEAEA